MNKQIKNLLPLIFFVALFVLFQNWWRIDLALNPISSESLNEEDVVIYTTTWCPYCRKARLFLNQAGIPFTEYDVEKSARAYEEYQRISGRGVPVIVVGDKIIQGFNKPAIKKALAQLNNN